MAKINITGLGKLGFPMACFLSKYNREINIFDINKKLTNIIDYLHYFYIFLNML